MTTMRLGLLLLTTLFALPVIPASAQNLSSVKKVYFLPMRSGFDQYLANQVSMQGAFEVVTDPLLADAIFTDQIGVKFERQLEELYPPEPEEKKVVEKTDEQAADASADAGNEEAVKEEEKPPVSSFSRGKGNIFLVDRASRKVVWSTYLTPKDNSSKQLNKSAEQLAAALRGGTSPN